MRIKFTGFPTGDGNDVATCTFHSLLPIFQTQQIQCRQWSIEMKIQLCFGGRLAIAQTRVLLGIAEHELNLKSCLVIAQNIQVIKVNIYPGDSGFFRRFIGFGFGKPTAYKPCCVSHPPRPAMKFPVRVPPAPVNRSKTSPGRNWCAHFWVKNWHRLLPPSRHYSASPSSSAGWR